LKHHILISLMAGALGCSANPTPEPSDTAPTPVPPKASPEKTAAVPPLPMETTEQWTGKVGLPEKLEAADGWITAADASVRYRAQVLRTPEALAAFVAKIPPHRLQKKRTNPPIPSDDPLLAGPKIDFSGFMVLVVVSSNMNSILKASAFRTASDRIEIQASDTPDAVHFQAMGGMGAYIALRTQRVPGKVSLRMSP
jgi:hypothetical protein